VTTKEYEIKLDTYTLYCTHEQFMTLKPRERKILELRFGLNGNERHTLRKVSEFIENRTYIGKPLHPSRIREIQNIALEKLCHPSRHTKVLWSDGTVTVRDENIELE
jgi:DNA-directed RNA polymerase sigma subunit (sigma70/sigma32)